MIRRLKAWETHGEVEGFRKLEGDVGSICGRRYVVLGPGGVQDTVERLENLASRSRGRLADGDTSSRSLEDSRRGGRVQEAGGCLADGDMSSRSLGGPWQGGRLPDVRGWRACVLRKTIRRLGARRDAERLENLASTSRGCLADGDTSS